MRSFQSDNGITIALITAGFALVGGFIGVFFQGQNQTNLERQKLQTSLILKALEPSDEKERAKYLIFLADAGLVNNLNFEKIKALAGEPSNLPRTVQSSNTNEENAIYLAENGNKYRAVVLMCQSSKNSDKFAIYQGWLKTLGINDSEVKNYIDALRNSDASCPVADGIY